MSNWNTHDEWAKVYLDVCKKAVIDNDTFNNFKSRLEYFRVVNQMKKQVSDIYFDYIKEHYPHLFSHFDKFKQNDIVGNPSTNEYDKIGSISGANLMYIKILGDIDHYIGGEFKTVAEIGGGFGGQAKVLHDFYPSIEKYYTYDLDPVMALQKKYLGMFGINPILSTYDEESEELDLVVANFSWSEFSIPYKKQYIEKVISKAKSGYISTNCPDSIGLDFLKSLFKDKEVTLIEDIPGKGNRHGKIIIWK